MTCYNSELPIGPPGPTGPQGIQGIEGPAGPVYTPPYKVYTALIGQWGGDNPQTTNGDDNIYVGFTYYISANPDNYDLTIYGAPNNNVGTYFTVFQASTPAFTIIPLPYTNSLVLTWNYGNPTVTVLENTLGFNPTWLRVSTGFYHTNNTDWLVPVSEKRVFTIFTPTIYYKDSNILRACGGSDTPGGVQITTGNYDINTSTYTPQDGLLRDDDNFANSSIEIRIYP